MLRHDRTLTRAGWHRFRRAGIRPKPPATFYAEARDSAVFWLNHAAIHRLSGDADRARFCLAQAREQLEHARSDLMWRALCSTAR